jgi:hypothetical protein
MKDGYGIVDPDWKFRLEKQGKPPPPLPEAPEPSMAIKGPTLGEEKLRLDVEIQELEADITRQLAGLPRWLRWLIRKGWPSIFKDL